MSKQNQGLGFPVATAAGLALTSISMGDRLTDFLKNNWKWVAGLGVVGLGSWLVYDKFFADNKNFNLQESSDYPPSAMSDFEAQKAADTLFSAMQAAGTDESLIYATLQNKTYNDFVKISNAFGTRGYSAYFGESYEGLFSEDLGLYEWLRRELSDEDLRQLQLIIPNVITTNLPILPGFEVAAKKAAVKVYEAENQDGTWVKTKLHDTYAKGEKIGEVIEVVTDKWEGTEFAIIDKPWSTQELFVSIEKITVI